MFRQRARARSPRRGRHEDGLRTARLDVEKAFATTLHPVAGWRLAGEALLLLDRDDREPWRFTAATRIGTSEATSVVQSNGVSSTVGPKRNPIDFGGRRAGTDRPPDLLQAAIRRVR